MKKQMIVQFSEEMFTQIRQVKEQLDNLPGIQVYLEPETLSYPGLQIETAGRNVYVNQVLVSLSAAEFDVLFHMAKKPGRVITYEQIYHVAYGMERAVEIRNSVYCLIRSLRKKLERNCENREYIQTVRDVGYKFVF